MLERFAPNQREFELTVVDTQWKVTLTFSSFKEAKVISQEKYFAIKKQLAQRQNDFESNGVEGFRHDQTVDFIHQNWGDITNLLYPKPTTKRFEPICFKEVSLVQNRKTYGRADIIGIGPDGAIIIMEVGSRGHKLKKLDKYARGVKNLIDDSSVTIHKFMARYVNGNGQSKSSVNIFNFP